MERTLYRDRTNYGEQVTKTQDIAAEHLSDSTFGSKFQNDLIDTPTFAIDICVDNTAWLGKGMGDRKPIENIDANYKLYFLIGCGSTLSSGDVHKMVEQAHASPDLQYAIVNDSLFGVAGYSIGHGESEVTVKAIEPVEVQVANNMVAKVFQFGVT